MNRLFRCIKKSESGEVMIEASMIMVSILILLIGLLSISFLFYQESLMNTIAIEIAENISKDFKYKDYESSGDTVVVTRDSDEVKMYRLSFGQSGLENLKEKYAEEYAENRMLLASLGMNSKEIDVECTIDCTGIGRAVARVKVSQQTDVFLGEILQLLGILENDLALSVTASSEIIDLTAYTSMANLVQYGAKVLDPFNPVGNLYVNAKNLIENLLD